MARGRVSYSLELLEEIPHKSHVFMVITTCTTGWGNSRLTVVSTPKTVYSSIIIN